MEPQSSRPDPLIDTSAEAAEDSVLPQLYEVHSDPEATPTRCEDLPDCMREPLNGKSAARWAYERLILYIRNFESQLDNKSEVAIGFTGGGAGVIRIEGIGYFDPDIVTFFGTDEDGARTQLIQHVTQLSVMLRALPVTQPEAAPRRIGFRLSRALQGEGPSQDAPGEPAHDPK